MHLAGQGASRHRPGSRLDDGGYIMVVLLIAMAAAAVWMSAALPAWRQQTAREREAELVFRGEQYARAIVLYQQKNNNALPPNIDLLVSQHYLRKKYKDPITGDDFVAIGGVQPGQQIDGVTPGGGGVGRAGGTSPGSASGQPVQLAGGISGVRSKSTATSIRIYQNQQVYSQWPFDASAMLARMGRTVSRAGAGGQGNQPGRAGGVPRPGAGGVGDARGGGPGRGGRGGGGGRGSDARPGGQPAGRGGGGLPVGSGGARGGGS
jgi:type II secretory pathway pseudopilin PulG